MKRTLDVHLVVETDLDDEQVTEIVMRATHDLTKRSTGRCVVAVGLVEDGGAFWTKLGLPEKPKPGADVIWRPK